VQNEHGLKNGANALNLASNVGPRFKAAGKPMIRKMVSMMNMVIHRLLVWTTTQSMEIARRKLRTML
jgi:GTP:adenosylcobinamide-phosphate guanylyltransferase